PIAEFAQSLAQLLGKSPSIFIRQHERADTRHLCLLLRARRERPSGRRAAKQRNELAPLHLRDHSITSSARASSVSGTVRPSAFAVFRLISSSNLTGAGTGSSLGLAPRRIRST